MKTFHPVVFAVFFTISSWIVYGVIGVILHDMIEEYAWNINIMTVFTVYFFLWPLIAIGSFLYMVWKNREWRLKNKYATILLLTGSAFVSVLYWIELIRIIPLK